MSQQIDLGVRLTGESDSYVSAIERAEASTNAIQSAWDDLRARASALTETISAIATASQQGSQVLAMMGVESDSLAQSIMGSAVAQEALAAATSVAETVLRAAGVEASGFGEILDGAKQIQSEFTDAIAAGGQGATEAAMQITQMATQLRFAGVTAEWTSGVLGKLKLAFLGLFAVFAVIQIAKQLYDESEAIQRIVARIVGMFKIGWSYIQEANDVLVAAIETKFKWVVQMLYPIFANFAERVGTILSYIPGLEGVGERLNAFAADLRKRLEDTRSFEERRSEITAEAEAYRAKVTADTAQRLLDIQKDFAGRKVAVASESAAAEVGVQQQANGEMEKLRESLAAAYVSLARATTESIFALQRDASQRELAELQRSLQAKFISETDYVARVAQLKEAAASAEIERIQQQQRLLAGRGDDLRAGIAAAEAGGNEKRAIELKKELVALQIQELALQKDGVVAQRNLLDITKQRVAELDKIARKENDSMVALLGFADAQRKDLDERLRGLDLEASLRGKSTTEQRIANEMSRLDLEYQRARLQLLAQIAAKSAEYREGEEPAEVIRTNLQLIADLKAAFDDLKAKTSRGIIDQGAFDQVKQLGDSLTDSIVGAFEQGKSVGAAFQNWLKASFSRLVLRPTVDFLVNGVLGGGAGGGGLLGLLGSIFGGSGGGSGGGILGSVLGIGGNSGVLSSIGGWLAGGAESGFMAGFGSFVSNMGSLGFTGAIQSAFSTAFANFAAGGAGGILTGLGSLLGPIGAIVGILAALGVFKNETGIKIDNSVRDGRGRRDIVTGAALGDFDVSGDLDNKVFEPLIKKVKDLDKYIADNLLSEDALARVRENIQRISSDATDWFGYDDEASAREAIGKASKLFLQQRYGTAFDEIDAGIASAIRNFEGSADELVAYISNVVVLSQAYDKIIEQVPFLNLTLGAFVNASDEARNTLATLGATIAMSTVDIAAEADAVIAANRRTLAESVTFQSERVLALADAFDGSLDKAQELAQAEAQRLQMLQALLVQIAQYTDQITSMFTSSAENFRLATMDDSDKYRYYDKQAADTFAELSQATDPERIRELAEKYNRYLNSAFGLLNEDQQRDLGDEYATLAEQAEAVARQQLEAAREAALEQSRQMGEDIRASIAAAMTKVADDMQTAADKLNKAADKIDDTFRKPLYVYGHLDTSDGRRVPLDQEAGAGA